MASDSGYRPGKVMFCRCIHKFQDKHYGKNKRLHNPLGGKGRGGEGYRCTVCGDVKK